MASYTVGKSRYIMQQHLTNVTLYRVTLFVFYNRNAAAAALPLYIGPIPHVTYRGFPATIFHSIPLFPSVLVSRFAGIPHTM